MAKHTSSPSEFDQHDPKVFKETLGSFGTTTAPTGENQLSQLQTKVRQGVKHVELHLSSSGKGQFGAQDVPDKYGFEQRRTIMQLAKLNKQSLSVHGTFEVNSFSGLGGQGFDETHRARNIKEIDETIKFAAETAKSGAVVFHLHETGLPPTSPGEINLPDKYLKWLKKNRREEFDNLMNKTLLQDDLNRQFVENPDLEDELKVKFQNMSSDDRNGFKNWKEYYQYNKDEQIKLEQDGTPLVVVGDSITRAQRGQDVIDVDGGYKKGLNEKEKEFLLSKGITTTSSEINIDDFQRIQAAFINKKQASYGNLSSDEYLNLRKKFVIEYTDILNDNNRMKSKSDKEFFQKSLDMQIKLANLQKEDLDMNKKRYGQYLDEIETIKNRERVLMRELDRATVAGDKTKEKDILTELNGGLTEKEQTDMEAIVSRAQQTGGLRPEDQDRYQELNEKSGKGLKQRRYYLEVQEVGQLEYQKLDRYDEMMAQLNEQIKKADEQKKNAKVMTDEIFDKNASAIGHLGIKALTYQLDLKERSKTAKVESNKLYKEIEALETKRNDSLDEGERNRLNAQVMKLKYKLRDFVGVEDYNDIDVKNNPLYVAPENIMAGYGYMDSLDEYKGVIRSSWEEFANKLLSDQGMYKKIREDYEKATGEKLKTGDKERDRKKALEIAKNHIGGTFDNAHAGVWMKYFKREKGESDEERIDRFNVWLNTEAEEMAKEGVIKHIHFNDTQAKDDDHNLLGSGVLDIHDLRERLRKAGIKESLIVEAGGRGANTNMHLFNAFDIFNADIRAAGSEGERGYRMGVETGGRDTVSDWVSVKREYENRPETSDYGMGYSTFRNQPPQDGNKRGEWSGNSFF